jgi:O-6-methylguanine DNA methyltransferase
MDIKDIKANSEFSRRVYEIVYKIPKGKTMTYGEIARMLNSSPRAVGQALKRNPNAPWVPCHRVIKSDDSMGGYNGMHGVAQKIDMLRKEGIRIVDGVKSQER